MHAVERGGLRYLEASLHNLASEAVSSFGLWTDVLDLPVDLIRARDGRRFRVHLAVDPEVVGEEPSEQREVVPDWLGAKPVAAYDAVEFDPITYVTFELVFDELLGVTEVSDAAVRPKRKAAAGPLPVFVPEVVVEESVPSL
ncbi:MAG: hypothetical protein Q4A07_13435 [Coriobacteriales bacterium]|nr:hypothetical protein [Coriobacteriales bacterium]